MLGDAVSEAERVGVSVPEPDSDGVDDPVGATFADCEAEPVGDAEADRDGVPVGVAEMPGTLCEGDTERLALALLEAVEDTLGDNDSDCVPLGDSSVGRDPDCDADALAVPVKEGLWDPLGVAVRLPDKDCDGVGETLAEVVALGLDDDDGNIEGEAVPDSLAELLIDELSDTKPLASCDDVPDLLWLSDSGDLVEDRVSVAECVCEREFVSEGECVTLPVRVCDGVAC